MNACDSQQTFGAAFRNMYIYIYTYIYIYIYTYIYIYIFIFLYIHVYQYMRQSTNVRSRIFQLPYGDQAIFITAARFRR